MEKHPLHLKNPELQTSPEVQRAVERKERKSGEKIPNDPTNRIEAYTDRLENIFLNPNEEVRERNLELLRPKIHDALIIKKENFPESYFELQRRIAREQGHGDIQITPEMREQMMDTAIADQKHSLDAWMDYLSSDDAVYPTWFKYYAWNQAIKLSQFDKERGEFKKRTESTVAPFPDIYREPLAQMADLYERVRENNKDPEARKEFDKKFPALYAELIQKSLAAQLENKEETRGQWVKYEQGDDDAAETLFASLEGKGTGWCTAGRSTAETQIESGDFYVYYTNDPRGNPVQPRLAIRMDGQEHIGEVRGILPHQGVEPVMQEVLDKKLQEFGPEADVYRKKSADMKQLTALAAKQDIGQPFTKGDLAFLYETDSTIEGFGYEKDPRVAELRDTRDIQQDMSILFDCQPNQIAKSPKEITKETKAYVGNLEPGIFEAAKFYNIEHVYAKFPEDRVRFETLEATEKTGLEYGQDITNAGMKTGDYAKDMLKSKEFEQRREAGKLSLVRLTVAALGFANGATTKQIYDRAKELGLELCPPNTGPELRLQYQNQPMGEYIAIGMEPITDRGGFPRVFRVSRGDDVRWLDGRWAYSDGQWPSDRQFVFRLQQVGET